MSAVKPTYVGGVRRLDSRRGGLAARSTCRVDLEYNPSMSPAPTPPPIPENMSEIGRLAGMFFSPMPAFADIVRRPRWWIPMILIGILSVAAIAIFSQHIGWDQIVRKSIDQNSQNMTTQQRQQAIAIASRIVPIVGYVAPVIAAVSIVVFAAVLILMTNVMLGADISFTSMMGIAGYASIPPTFVVAALTILVMFLKSPDDFDIQNPLAFNLGAFLSDGSARWLVTLCRSMDLFTFWRIGLLAVGITAAAPKLKLGKALAAVIIPWLVWVALTTGLASLSR